MEDKKRTMSQDESRRSTTTKSEEGSTAARNNSSGIRGSSNNGHATSCSWRDRRKTQLKCARRKKLWCSSCEAAHPKTCFSHAERHLPEPLRQCTGSRSRIRLCAHRRLNHSEMRRACASDDDDDEKASASGGTGSSSGSRLLCAEGCLGVERYRAERTRGYPHPHPPYSDGSGRRKRRRRATASTQLFRRHVRLDVDERARLGVDDHELLAAVFAADARLCPHMRVADCLNDFRFAGAPAAHFHPKGQDRCSDACSDFFWCPRSYEGCNTSLYLYSQRVRYPHVHGDGNDDDDDVIDEVAEEAEMAEEAEVTVGSGEIEAKTDEFDQIHLLSFRNLGAMDDPNDTAWLMQLEDGWRACAKRNRAKFWSRVRRKVRQLLRC